MSMVGTLSPRTVPGPRVLRRVPGDSFEGMRYPPPASPSALFPGRVNRFADQERRIRAGLGPVFLHAPVVHLGHIEIAVLVHARSMHSPHGARSVAPRAPRVEEMPGQIVLQRLGRSAVEGPQVSIRAD